MIFKGGAFDYKCYGTAQVQGNVRTRQKRIQDSFKMCVSLVRDACETRSRHMRDTFKMRAGRVRD